jgi:serralysin
LTPAQWDFEFKQSKLVIEQNLKLQNIGMAYPGNPENMPVNEYLRTTFPYLSGGYSGVGAGYPGAMGVFDAGFQKRIF